MIDISNSNLVSHALSGQIGFKTTSSFNNSTDVEKELAKNDELRGVANQFEAIFLEMLLKQARESKLSEGLFDTKSDDNFVQMFDAELAKSSSENVDIGIAEAIIRQMSLQGSGT